MDLIASILTFVAWLGVSALLLVLYRIAHFYQATSGQSTHYQLFLAPLVLLLLGGIRYALAGDVAGDMVGDSIQLAGGVALIFLGASLLKMMTGGRR
jgi:hypothetical protein